jgi:hypothetical protein
VCYVQPQQPRYAPQCSTTTEYDYGGYDQSYSNSYSTTELFSQPGQATFSAVKYAPAGGGLAGLSSYPQTSANMSQVVYQGIQAPQPNLSQQAASLGMPSMLQGQQQLFSPQGAAYTGGFTYGFKPSPQPQQQQQGYLPNPRMQQQFQ